MTWTFISILAAFYLLIFVLKLKYYEAFEKLYEKWGLDVGLFQLKWSFSAKGRWTTNLSSMRRCKTFYKYGTVVSLLLIVPSLIFLVWNLVKMIYMAWPMSWQTSSTEAYKLHTVERSDLIFQPVVPGITFPIADAGVYALGLLLSSAFHELGHAVAADCQDVKLLGYGLLIIFVIPAAFVELSTSELKALSPTDQLKVYAAGIWHNLVLALMAFAFICALPTMMQAFYVKDNGVAVLQLKANSSVQGPSGLSVGQTITAVNDCPVKSVSDFYTCVRSQDQKGFCLVQDDLAQLHCQDCCEIGKNNGTFLTFQSRGRESDQLTSYCLPARKALNVSHGFCHYNCHEDQVCIQPVLEYPHQLLWQIKRGQGDKDFIFIGYSTDLLSGVEALTDYIPARSYTPLGFPLLIEKSLYYTCSFSLALALINVVPCLMLDGQFIIKTLMDICCPSRAQCISKLFVYFGSGLLLANIGLAFLLLK